MADHTEGRAQPLSGVAPSGPATDTSAGIGRPGPVSGYRMRRCTFSSFEGPGSASATHGPGIDGSIMPASSQA